jgi:hypothetical protein
VLGRAGQLHRPDMHMTDLVNHLRIRRVDLIPGLGIRGGSGVEARLRLAMIHSLLTERLPSECLDCELVSTKNQGSSLSAK